MKLAEHMFPDSINAIRSLSDEPSSAFLIAKQVGREMMEKKEFVGGFSLETMCALTSQACFADSEEECMAVAVMIMVRIKSVDVLPMVSQHKARDLASRCLVSLGFFMPAMEHRYRYRGSPSPGFYREVGIAAFMNNDMENMAGHFGRWEGFLQEMFVLDSKKQENII